MRNLPAGRLARPRSSSPFSVSTRRCVSLFYHCFFVVVVVVIVVAAADDAVGYCTHVLTVRTQKESLFPQSHPVVWLSLLSSRQQQHLCSK